MIYFVRSGDAVIYREGRGEDAAIVGIDWREGPTVH